jgi:hypothetical protein
MRPGSTPNFVFPPAQQIPIVSQASDTTGLDERKQFGVSRWNNAPGGMMPDKESARACLRRDESSSALKKFRTFWRERTASPAKCIKAGGKLSVANKF